MAIILSGIRCAVFLAGPGGNGKNARIVDLPEGYTLKRIALDLERAGLVSSDWLFVLYAKFKGAEGKVKAGVYRLDDGMTPSAILGKLLAGDVYARQFAVPEGYSIYQIAELLDRRGIFTREEFLDKCSDEALLRDMGIRALSVEGYLYPCTYDITPRTTPEGLIREMVSQFRKHYSGKLEVRAGGRRMNSMEILTLASMVEKEAVAPVERPLIASVFLNRLSRKMPLQSDPTAVYRVRPFAGRISKTDITLDSPYNTYKIKGLPPGPIGNPGREAINAVLNPARTEYLYFVARMDGTHHFSETLEEHNRAVRKYLRSRPEPAEAQERPRPQRAVMIHRQPGNV